MLPTISSYSTDLFYKETIFDCIRAALACVRRENAISMFCNRVNIFFSLSLCWARSRLLLNSGGLYFDMQDLDWLYLGIRSGFMQVYSVIHQLRRMQIRHLNQIEEDWQHISSLTILN